MPTRDEYLDCDEGRIVEQDPTIRNRDYIFCLAGRIAKEFHVFVMIYGAEEFVLRRGRRGRRVAARACVRECVPVDALVFRGRTRDVLASNSSEVTMEDYLRSTFVTRFSVTRESIQ